MTLDEIQTVLTDWINMYSGIYNYPNILIDYPALMAIPTASRTVPQQALWQRLNAKVIDFAQNPVRPIPPFISVHLQSSQKQGSTPYKGATVANKSQLATFNGAFSAGNIAAFTINSVIIPAIAFDTDNATTYADIQAALQLAFPDAVILVDPVALTVYIYQLGVSFTMLCSVTGGTPPAATITAPYSKTDTPIKYVDKINLYLQAFGEGSSLYFQNLQDSLLTEDTQQYLAANYITYISDTGIQDIHTLLDNTMEERFSFDLVFLVGQIRTESTYDIIDVPNIGANVSN